MAGSDNDFDLKIEDTQRNTQEDMFNVGGGLEESESVESWEKDHNKVENGDGEDDPRGRLPYSQKHLSMIDPMIRKDLGLDNGEDDEDDDDNDEKEDDSDSEDSSMDMEGAGDESEISNKRKDLKITGMSEEKAVLNKSVEKIIEEKEIGSATAGEVKNAKEGSPNMVREIEQKRRKKRKLKEDIKDLDAELETAEEKRNAKRVRVGVLKGVVKQQAKELKQQDEDRKKGKVKSFWKGISKGMDGKTKEATLMIETLSDNVKRMAHGKQKCPDKTGGTEIKTLEEIQNSGKFVVVFSPEVAAIKNESVKIEMDKIANFVFATYKEYGLTDLVTKIKNYTPELAKEKNIGVIMISWMEGAGVDDDEVREKFLNNWMEMLQLAIKRAEDKFGEIIVVLPPASEKTLDAMELLSKKVLDLMKDPQAVINLLQIQKNVGRKLKKEQEKVWKIEKNGTMLAKIFCQGESGEMADYAVGRTLAELAKNLGGLSKDKDLCERCGLTHMENFCYKTDEEKRVDIKSEN